MTEARPTATGSSTGSSERKRTTRSALGLVFAVLLTVSGFLAATLTWTDHYVFNAPRFAERADRALDSPAVRAVLSDQITAAIVQTGPSEVASFQAVIRPAVEGMIGTPAFRSIFRDALRQGHDYLFTKHGNAVIVNMSQALGVLSASLNVSNPSVASMLPENSDTFLVDLGNTIRGLELWRISRTVSDYGWTALVLTIACAIATVVVDGDRRRGVFRLGIAAATSGALMFAAALIAPIVAGSYANTKPVEDALRDATSTFMADYRTGALWLVGIGIAIAAFATAIVPTTAPRTTGELIERGRARLTSAFADTTRTRVLSSIALMVTGAAIILWTEVFFELVAVVVAATLLYLGAVRLLAIVGRADTAAVRSEANAEATVVRRRIVRVTIGGATLVGLLIVGGIWATSDARAKTIQNDKRRCNGHAELCGKRLDEVAFAGSHNAMSVSTDPGWLFFEQGRSIPAQLDSGIRALLMKTHYGIPTTIRVTGADLVVTDRAAELAANPVAEDGEYTPEQQAQLARLTATVPNVDPALRDVYLCHVNCEFGATRFVTALGYVRQFLARNPDEVVILFIGDYVSTEDTEKAFRDAKLLDRLWRYDPSGPMPTLGELIDARTNIIYLPEFSGQPPAWQTPGYGIFQDTPYTFRTTSDLLTPGATGYTGSATVSGQVPDTTVPSPGAAPVFTKDWSGLPSCAPNRGTPSSPLFQINHWVTPAGAPPTADQARVVNARGVLLPAVRNCMTQRGRFPTIIGVNFAEVGDLFTVVDEINGFARP